MNRKEKKNMSLDFQRYLCGIWQEWTTYICCITIRLDYVLKPLDTMLSFIINTIERGLIYDPLKE